MGDRAGNIACALQKLAELPTIHIVQVSALYETAPVGITEQPDFLNAAAHIQTTLSPHALLAHILQIEREMGRIRTVRWGPRPIDIDILAFGNVTIQTPELTVPHPRLTDRAFVLAPLAGIAPHLLLPGQKKTVQELLQMLPKTGTI